MFSGSAGQMGGRWQRQENTHFSTEKGMGTMKYVQNFCA
jgi:hypothetical protein